MKRLGISLVCLAGVLQLLQVQAQEVPLVNDQVFQVPISRAFRTRFGVFVSDQTPVIHVHSAGPDRSRLIDARSGQEWAAEPEKLRALRGVYDYDTSQEPRDSHLLKLGCGEWRVCTDLEGADFVVMAREGARRDQLEFRLLDFGPLFRRIEAALAGQPVDPPRAPMSAREAAAITHAATKTEWRLRWRDAMRSVDSLERADRLNRSPWLTAIGEISAMNLTPQGDLPLSREVGLARCRAMVLAARPGLANDDAASLSLLIEALGQPPGRLEQAKEQLRCTDFFQHVMDWTFDMPADSRRRASESLAKAAGRFRNDDLLELSRFLAELPLGASSKPRAEPAGVVARPSAPDRPRPSASGPGSGAGPMPQRGAAPSAGARPTAEFGPPDLGDEVRRISGHPNKIQLLSFDEKGGLTRPDENSLAGTTFYAQVSGKSVEAGRFIIEARSNEKSPVRMVLGKYRVAVKARLIIVRVDRCESALKCIFSKSESVETYSLSHPVEFQLLPSDFTSRKMVGFGPLKPPDLAETGAIKSSLREVRLIIELTKIEPL